MKIYKFSIKKAEQGDTLLLLKGGQIYTGKIIDIQYNEMSIQIDGQGSYKFPNARIIGNVLSQEEWNGSIDWDCFVIKDINYIGLFIIKLLKFFL